MADKIVVKQSGGLGCLGAIGLAVVLAILIPAFWFGGCCTLLGIGAYQAQKLEQPARAKYAAIPTSVDENSSAHPDDLTPQMPSTVPSSPARHITPSTQPYAPGRPVNARYSRRSALTDSIGYLERELSNARLATETAKTNVETAREALSKAAAVAAGQLHDDPDYLEATKAADNAETRLQDLRGRATSTQRASASTELIKAKELVHAIAAAKTSAVMSGARDAFDKAKLENDAAEARVAVLEKALAKAQQQLVEIPKVQETALQNAFAGSSNGTITFRQFQQLKDGMSYDQVYRILGRHGKEISRIVIDGETTLMLVWENPDFSNMNATFQNGRLVSRAHFGLE